MTTMSRTTAWRVRKGLSPGYGSAYHQKEMDYQGEDRLSLVVRDLRALCIKMACRIVKRWDIKGDIDITCSIEDLAHDAAIRCLELRSSRQAHIGWYSVIACNVVQTRIMTARHRGRTGRLDARMQAPPSGILSSTGEFRRDCLHIVSRQSIAIAAQLQQWLDRGGLDNPPEKAIEILRKEMLCKSA